MLKPGIGIAGSMSILPSALGGPYGSRVPLGAAVFLTLRPAAVSTVPGTDPHAGHLVP